MSETAEPTMIDNRLECPKCKNDTMVPKNGNLCPNCGTTIDIEVEYYNNESGIDYVYFTEDQYVSEKIRVDAKRVNDFSIRIDLSSVAQKYKKEHGTSFIPIEISLSINKGETPEWYDGSAFDFICETIEGQELLEYAAVVYNISKQLKLDPPKHSAYDPHNKDTAGNINRWEDIGISDVSPTEAFLDMVDTPAETYIYTLKLVNIENDRVIYYVGKSASILSRLSEHVRVGGSFSHAKRNGNFEVYSIESIKPQTEVTEREQYNIMVDKVAEDVYGGQ